tara:strand:+ start:19040 stop:20161 length:1122 start_codon:yes stop_codon:yes gene_type:complete
MEKKMENKKQKDRNFLGIWIPKDVYLNKDLSWLEKIMLVEIESLDNQDGCFASNDYFADFLDVTKTTISSAISKLKNLGFVEQVSFDGRRRVLKICQSAYKKTERQPKEKVETSIKENFEHSNTLNKQDINPIKKEEKINTKSFSEFEKKDLKKMNDIKNGSVCIEVDELKNSHVWLESTAKHLKVSMFWINSLLKDFIEEQKLKDDSFKSFRETKTHFLNWAKIQIFKSRKTDDRWGRVDPSHTRQIRKEVKKKEISNEEKQKLHNDFIISNLINPFNKYIETDQIPKINDFGSLISNELKKFNLLFDDQVEITKFKSNLKPTDQIKSTSKNRIGSFMKTDRSKEMVKNFIFRKSFEKMKSEKINLEKILIK